MAMAVESDQTSPIGSRRRRVSSESSLPSKKKKRSGSCCLRSCSNALNDEDERADIRAFLPRSKSALQSFLQSSVVEWSRDGDATFHRACWNDLLRNVRVRKHKNMTMRIGSKEKAVVKEAAKTVEFHDSRRSVKEKGKKIAAMIKSSKYCVAFTGAGISTAAGIGDYRGKEGRWTKEDRRTTAPVADDTDAQLEDGEEEVLDDDGVPYEGLRPTYTHEALAKLIESGLVKHIISQNGDGLHGLSGVEEQYLSELHGNVFLEVCEKCGYRYHRPFYVLNDDVYQHFEEIQERGVSDIEKPKFAVKCDTCNLCHRTGRKCKQPQCHGHLKDSIINFGDNLEEEVLTRAESNASQADLILSLGTTMQVTPACNLVLMAKHPQRIVIVNRQQTGFDAMCFKTEHQQQLGVRVFGDCDSLMREVMQHVMEKKELKKWEVEREKRLKEYATFRDSF